MENQNASVKSMEPTPSSSEGMGKKAWRQPRLTRLDLKDTKGGSWDVNYECEWWFISLHS